MMNSVYRDKDKSGSWCFLLLPFCLLAHNANFERGTNKILFIFSSWLSISSFLIESMSIKQTNKKFGYVFLCSLLFVIITAIIYMASFYSYTTLFILSVISLICHYSMISAILKSFPNCFTFGEVHLIGQSVTLFLFNFFLKILHHELYQSFNPSNEISPKFLQILMMGIMALIFLLYKFPSLQASSKFYLTFINIICLTYICYNYYLHYNPIIWLLDFCLQNNVKINLILFWVCCTLASIGFVMFKNRDHRQKASTITRKYFHIIIDLVFIPGVIYDPELLFVASGVAFAIFVILEVFRTLKLEPIGSTIDNAFHLFLDEKDSGALIVTHIYLLVGCASPLWLCSNYLINKGYHICLLSGIISVGIGDATAAVAGILFGIHKWKGSNKTVEGTICAIIIQSIFTYIFLYYGHVCSSYNIMLVILAVISTSLLEAHTSQVDNLILPLFMFSFLAWIH